MKTKIQILHTFLYFNLLIVTYIWFGEAKCHSGNLDIQNYLSTKTPYRFILNNNDSKIDFSECKPEKIWMVIRHGTRYPGTKIISKIHNDLMKFRNTIVNESAGSLCQSEIDGLIQWKPRVQIADDKNLSHEGEDEMIELAERFKNRFPELFPNEYANSTYKFKYTATQRTAESARHFAIGLFGRKVSRYVWFPEPVHKDPILRFYKLCRKWTKVIKKNSETYQEKALFENSAIMQNVINEVSERFGLKQAISPELLTLVYKTCGFETAWSSHYSSPWCAAFSNNSLKVLAYAEDLKYYWVDGYGYNLTYIQACPAIKNLFEFFDMENYASTVAYFTHSGTMLKLLAHLGLYKDNMPLTHDQYENNSDRKWKTGFIDAFGSNLAFVLYDCKKEKHVLTLHQEQIVHIPGCPSSDLCPLHTLKEIFSNSINNCTFEEICMFTKPN